MTDTTKPLRCKDFTDIIGEHKMQMEVSISMEMFETISRGLLTHPHVGSGYLPAWRNFGKGQASIRFDWTEGYEDPTTFKVVWDMDALFDIIQYILNHTKLDDPRVPTLQRWMREPHYLLDNQVNEMFEWLVQSWLELKEIN
jgi:hypothetical protein